MIDKKWLVEGFCSVDKYNCLMPVGYEKEESGGVVKQYHKKGMACRHALSGECDLGEECEFYKKAPDILEKNSLWYK